MNASIVLNWIAFVILVVGGLNWGLVGIFGFNLVSFLFGAGILSSIIYILVFVSALWLLISLFVSPAIWFGKKENR